MVELVMCEGMIMKNGFGRFVRLIGVVAVCLAMAMPASAAKVLNRGNGAEPKGLDPHQASGDPENQILGDLFIGLYTEDVKGKVWRVFYRGT